MVENIELKDAVKIRVAMEEYRDSVYLNIMRQINDECKDILTDDMGSKFVKNCGRDIAGEVIRNCFDTSAYNITVDQLAKRFLEFSYDNEYDPLSNNGGVGDLQKSVYNYNELQSTELDMISNIMNSNYEKLFSEDREKDSLDRKGKNAYRAAKTDESGNVYDELTGEIGTKSSYTMNGKEVFKSDLQADHVQARESAQINTRYVTNEGKECLKVFWNSEDNMQMMHASANASKGDIRVCEVEGQIKYVNARSNEYDPKTDITHKASAEQLAEAVCQQWEARNLDREGQSSKKIEKLKEKGYLNEEDKVPKSVKRELIYNIRHSQNMEGKTILENTDYKKVAEDAKDFTKASLGKIVAGQIIYYAAPPLLYEVRVILKDKSISIENALSKLEASAKRVGEYVLSKLKNIFINITFNSLKQFIKAFMDILINMVKATVKKLLKMTKNLILSTVDAVRIIGDKQSTKAEKANAVCNLYAVTITSCVVEILFELAAESLHIPEPFDDIVFGPLQILTTVICTNLTMLILKKADLFDVEFGFKMSQVRKLFSTSRQAYEEANVISQKYADEQIEQIIQQARYQSKEIYNSLMEINPHKESARPELEKISRMFSMDIDFEKEWLYFLGISV